jgi:hypothetical protein
MKASSLLDTTFDFRSDTPAGKDPDAFSPTLRKYHKQLWSRPLPNGVIFTLDDTNPRIYLHHISELGEFSLSSDSAIHSFSKWKSMAHIMSQIEAEEIEEFKRIGYTIGGMLIFPANRIDGKSTINGARGMHPLIKDRIDLTLECIRRYYLNENSPLSDTLRRYKNFFELFGNFQSYVNFFLLQDLVTEDFKSIKFLIRFDNFKPPTVPTNLDEYLAYKDLAIKFVHNRNKRIILTIDRLT